MSLRSRLSISVVAGTFLAAAVATPAVADDDWSGHQSDSQSNSQSDWSNSQNDSQGDSQSWSNSQNDSGGNWGGHQQSSQRLYKGVVTASTLRLRSKPTTGSQVIRYAYQGEIVSIFCKTGGQNVDGNHLWYLLTDGTWAWGAARYIDNIGAAPRWC
ncbi:SH3 domain-containing protein [Streptomyces sp. S3(2020)]|uniref:SH3 domain-containing protein n=1 Tax=Streptomyces sp. S3(2020) TaxID=2732044 RepID=UPI0014887A06|nr:SH3 domain-containing protein [Streptomyces sp. S3(2020)]NNN35046.1 SH3 domain-containing protein [Streptomyces sp. S3(2020)]